MRIGTERAAVLVEEERALAADLDHEPARAALGDLGSARRCAPQGEHDDRRSALSRAERAQRLARRLLAGYGSRRRGQRAEQRCKEREYEPETGASPGREGHEFLA